MEVHLVDGTYELFLWVSGTRVVQLYRRTKTHEIPLLSGN